MKIIDRCLKCGEPLKGRGKRVHLVCPACSVSRVYEIVNVTCPCCGREFKTSEDTYAGLIDACPHCGEGK